MYTAEPTTASAYTGWLQMVRWSRRKLAIVLPAPSGRSRWSGSAGVWIASLHLTPVCRCHMLVLHAKALLGNGINVEASRA